MKDSLPVLVIGGGVAGISAALDIANAGRSVFLVENGHTLGGQVAKLDKLYPTDHCAFCPLWTDIKRLREHPLITVHTGTEVKELRRIEGRLHAMIVKNPPVIDASRCVFCGKCERECSQKAICSAGEHVYPPVCRVDLDVCNHCGACVAICPTAAINFQRADETIALNIDHVVWASGFKEVDLTPLKEFGFGTHPDIMTSLEFEEWTAEGGGNRANITRKTTGTVPRIIAFIQCAGARDERMLPYCSAVCCMHAFKQAKWVKRRNPAIHCVIFYTDLRTVGRDYYEYSLQEIGGSPIRLIRGRPSLIYPLPGGNGIAVKFENTETQKRDIWKFDMVVLNGNLRSSLEWTDQEKLGSPALTEEGFVNPESGDMSRFSCGFSMAPSDVAESAIQAASVAARVLLAKREG
jgi:heterodisulfide reductase subunit A